MFWNVKWLFLRLGKISPNINSSKIEAKIEMGFRTRQTWVEPCLPGLVLVHLVGNPFTPSLSWLTPICPYCLLEKPSIGLPFSSPRSGHPLCSQSSVYWLQQQQSQPYTSGMILSVLHICNTYSAQEPRRQGLWDELFLQDTGLEKPQWLAPGHRGNICAPKPRLSVCLALGPDLLVCLPH